MSAISSEHLEAIVTALQNLRRVLASGPKESFPEGIYMVAGAGDPKFAQKFENDPRRKRAGDFCSAVRGVRDALHLVGLMQHAPEELEGAWRILSLDLSDLDYLPASITTLLKLKKVIEGLGGKEARRPVILLVAEETTILEALADNCPTIMTREDLTTPTRLTEKTIGKYLDCLLGKKLVCQPAGTKKGWGITEAGLLAIGR